MGVMDILKATARHLGTGREGVASFVGPASKTFDWDALLTAMRAETAGQSRDDIWLNTLTGRAPSGKWMQEISNADSSTNFDGYNLGGHFPRERGYTARLGDVFDDPALFAADPDLQKLSLDVMPYDPADIPGDPWAKTMFSAIDFSPKGMQIAGRYAHDDQLSNPVFSARAMLTHEGDHVQHGRSGIGWGGMPSVIAQRMKRARVAMNTVEVMQRARESVRGGFAPDVVRALDDDWMLSDVDKAPLIDHIRQYGEGVIDDMERTARADPYLNVMDPRQHYHRADGEGLARVTQQSLNLGDVERRVSPPWERMENMSWEPMRYADAWNANPSSVLDNLQYKQIIDRAMRGDALGRALADVIRASAGAGGVLAAANVAGHARRRQHGREVAA